MRSPWRTLWLAQVICALTLSGCAARRLPDAPRVSPVEVIGARTDSARVTANSFVRPVEHSMSWLRQELPPYAAERIEDVKIIIDADDQSAFQFFSNTRERKTLLPVGALVSLVHVAQAQYLAAHVLDDPSWEELYYLYLRQLSRISGAEPVPPLEAAALNVEQIEDGRESIAEDAAQMLVFLLAHELAHHLRGDDRNRSREERDDFVDRNRRQETAADKLALELMSSNEPAVWLGASRFFVTLVRVRASEFAPGRDDSDYPADYLRAQNTAKYALQRLQAFPKSSKVEDVSGHFRDVLLLCQLIDTDPDYLAWLDERASRATLEILRLSATNAMSDEFSKLADSLMTSRKRNVERRPLRHALLRAKNSAMLGDSRARQALSDAQAGGTVTKLADWFGRNEPRFKSYRFYNEMAHVAFLADRHDLAVRALNAMIVISPGRPRLVVALAHAETAGRNWRRAEELLKSVLQQADSLDERTRGEAEFLLAGALVRRNENEEALAHLKLALPILEAGDDPSASAQANAQAGVLFMEAGQSEDAIKAFEKMQQIVKVKGGVVSDLPTLLVKLGNVYLKSERVAEARSAFESAYTYAQDAKQEDSEVLALANLYIAAKKQRDDVAGERFWAAGSDRFKKYLSEKDYRKLLDLRSDGRDPATGPAPKQPETLR